MKTLIPYIWAAGVVQLIVAAANFFIPKKLAYAENLARVSPMVRQIFRVHAAYIVGVLLFWSALCFLFAPELAGGSRLGRFLSGLLALFWLPRVGIQLFYYDAEVKRQNRLAHFVFTAVFLYLGFLFTLAALGVFR